MPELPEVETVRRTLEPVVLGKEIERVQVFWQRVLQNGSPAEFAAALLQNRFLDLRRRGKYLLFGLEHGLELVVHLRMTGRLIYYSSSAVELDKHTTALIEFAGGEQLRLVDVRKFATVHLVEAGAYSPIKGLTNLGVEPLCSQFSADYLEALAAGRPVKIKGLLLDQSKIAGLGNIYTDESLFRAGLHPERPANSLTEAEILKLHGAICEVLQEAIRHQGTTLRDYRTGQGREGSFQNELRIYGKKGQACPRCGNTIEHKKVAGRTSHFCPECQKE